MNSDIIYKSLGGFVLICYVYLLGFKDNSNNIVSETKLYEMVESNIIEIKSVYVNRNENFATIVTFDKNINDTKYDVMLPRLNVYEFEDRLHQVVPLVDVSYVQTNVSWRIYDILHYTLYMYVFLKLLRILIQGLVSKYFSRNRTVESDDELDENFSLSSMFSSKMDVEKVKSVDTRFSDVAGCTEAKRDIERFVKVLKERDRFIEMGASLPRGVLLTGPPGCGKTLLAKAVAGEAGVSFLSTTGSDFNEMFVGVGASRVKKLFERARKLAPSIIYIDEIDSIGAKRGKQSLQEQDSVLNKILTEMDGFKNTDNVIVFASTNMVEKLDKALLRSGRFDNKIIVDYPSVTEREAIIGLYLQKLKLDIEDETDMNIKLAQKTIGMTGADIRNFINQATIESVLDDKKTVTYQYLENAIDDITIGSERRSKGVSEEELNTIAFHEAGHALIGYVLKEANSPIKISIIPRGSGALGYTQPGIKEVSLHKRSDLVGKIHVLYGGRVAEALMFGTITSGASDDIEKASRLMMNMYCKLGMSIDIGEVHYDFDSSMSCQMKFKIEMEVAESMKTIYKLTYKIMKNNKTKLISLADLLLIKETLDEDDIHSILGDEIENSLSVSLNEVKNQFN